MRKRNVHRAPYRSVLAEYYCQFIVYSFILPPFQFLEVFTSPLPTSGKLNRSGNNKDLCDCTVSCSDFVLRHAGMLPNLNGLQMSSHLAKYLIAKTVRKK